MIEHLIDGLKALWRLSETAVRIILIASVLTNAYFAFNLNKRTTDLELERVRWDEQRRAEIIALSDVRRDVRQAVDTIILLSARITVHQDDRQDREDRKR